LNFDQILILFSCLL